MQIVKHRLVVVALLACLANAHAEGPQAPQQAAPAREQWKTFISATALHDWLDQEDLLVIDVRSAADYAAGHIPGAINLPSDLWRTPAAGPGQVGQQIFSQADGRLDVKRYEDLLSQAGVKPEHNIVVYGNHAGRADGTVPAAILLDLGHRRVSFLDGVGLAEWRAAGYPVSTDVTQLPESQYVAQADAVRVWTSEKLLANLENPDVVIIDSRTPAEFTGEALLGNKRGGHIPGAVSLNQHDFLDRDTRKTIDAAAARQRIEAEIPKDKTVVLYCQSGTRCSHKILMLKDLGYQDVVLYDSSWQEWGNRLDLPIAGPDAPAATSGQ